MERRGQCQDPHQRGERARRRQRQLTDNVLQDGSRNNNRVRRDRATPASEAARSEGGVQSGGRTQPRGPRAAQAKEHTAEEWAERLRPPWQPTWWEGGLKVAYPEWAQRLKGP